MSDYIIKQTNRSLGTSIYVGCAIVDLKPRRIPGIKEKLDTFTFEVRVYRTLKGARAHPFGDRRAAILMMENLREGTVNSDWSIVKA